ncbi:hypothetical protein CNMCM5793_009013 [Aspergillus hiratsukae]|uniref:CUE domain-containing protein n=1 Tax=Aspergillus hiratsukae TaxID=1194566 RepID=A0A8H6UCM8_9EURO|nr:hypothetical protein CNMCM5793_009013 [Aspergillus hiratsukae]KAF7159978.1 hypothetical protein CNMCM6106_007393 [Aspergillus hiratsukae]
MPLKGAVALVISQHPEVRDDSPSDSPSESFETFVCKLQCPDVPPVGSITLLLVPLTKELLLLLDKRSDQTKVQEAIKRTVTPKKCDPGLRVNDDDDEDGVESVALPPKSIGSGTSIPSSGRIPAWQLDNSFGPDAPILSPPPKNTGSQKSDKGGDIPLRKWRGPVIELDDEERNRVLSLKSTSRTRPGTLLLSATGRVELTMTAGGGMDSNDNLDRKLARLVASFPAYDVDNLRELLQANGNDVSAAIRMLDGQEGLDVLADLLTRFPTYEVEVLKDMLQDCGGNVDEAVAQIELVASDESKTLCEGDVQEHDEESDQIDDETVNAEELAAMMGGEEVYDSDQEDEDDSEYTDAGARALADVEYTDSFESTWYSRLFI